MDKNLDTLRQTYFRMLTNLDILFRNFEKDLGGNFNPPRHWRDLPYETF